MQTKVLEVQKDKFSIRKRRVVLLHTWKSKRTSWTSRALHVGYLY